MRKKTCSNHCNREKLSSGMAAQLSLPPDTKVPSRKIFVGRSGRAQFRPKPDVQMFVCCQLFVITCSSLRRGFPTQATVPRKLLFTWAVLAKIHVRGGSEKERKNQNHTTSSNTGFGKIQIRWNIGAANTFLIWHVIPQCGIHTSSSPIFGMMSYQLKEVLCGGIEASLPGGAQHPQDVFSRCRVHQKTLHHHHCHMD